MSKQITHKGRTQSGQRGLANSASVIDIVVLETGALAYRTSADDV